MNALPGRTIMDRRELEAIVGTVLHEAKARGVDQAEASASHDIGLSTTARLGEVESLEYTNDRGVGITVYKEGKKGGASTTDFSPGALKEAVAKACKGESMPVKFLHRTRDGVGGGLIGSKAFVQETACEIEQRSRILKKQLRRGRATVGPLYCFKRLREGVAVT